MANYLLGPSPAQLPFAGETAAAMIAYQLRALGLELADPFRIAHGTSLRRDNLVLELRCADLRGYGEAAVVPYYPYTAPAIQTALQQLVSQLQPDWLGQDPATIPALDLSAPPPARAALDLALHDLWGQRADSPLYQLWGLTLDTLRSSYTVSIERDLTRFGEKLAAVSSFGQLKLKLGCGDPAWDLQLVQAAREVYSGPLAIDVNGGWSPAQAASIISQLASCELLFIEQPVPARDLGAWRELRQLLPAGSPPLIADESLQQAADLDRLSPWVDGINIKLAKCGGLQPARQLIATARSRGLLVLLGCMVESSLAVTATAHLAPLADFLDLDGHLLLKDDPFCGIIRRQDCLELPHAPGIGARPRNF